MDRQAVDIAIEDAFKALYLSHGVKDLKEIKSSWKLVRINLSVDEIGVAIKKLSQKTVFKLTPGLFVEAIKGTQKQKVQSALEDAISAAIKYGHTNINEAKSSLGDLVWAAIGGKSGYLDICRNDMANNTSFYAQKRDLIENNLLNPNKLEELKTSIESKDVTKLIEKMVNKK